MNGKDRYLIDTNILIYFLQGDKVAVSFLKKILDDELCISLINKIEVLSFPDLSKDEEKEETIKIRKKYKLKLGDALICATSIMHDTILVSRNEKDFIKVKGLKFLNPYTTKME